MLVAGDFNSVPGSAAHSLLVKGRVEPQQLVRRKVSAKHIALQLKTSTCVHAQCSSGVCCQLLPGMCVRILLLVLQPAGVAL
jgi:hypothetical protein